MRGQDVVNAKRDVERFLQANGTTNIYAQNNGYGLYVNWLVKSITIHGPASSDWEKAQNIKGIEPNTFNPTQNGFWIGHFDSFEKAYTFSDLLRRALYIQTREEMLLAAGKNINFEPFKLF